MTTPKKVAAIILNRNLPRETERLYEKLCKSNSEVCDIFVVESGSDESNLSKYHTWWADWEESLEHGLRYPRGFNYALSQLMSEGRYNDYEFFLLLCNDAEIPEGPWVNQLVDIMVEHPRVGILSPCSKDWGERDLIGPEGTRYFWYVNLVSWMLRREYVDDVRELENPNYMNFIYDGTNFRGYESDIELIAKGYVNDWATAITTRVMVEENKSHIITKADLIRTEPYEESLVMCLQEGKKWLRRKYGFNSRWSMQMYAKSFYDRFFEHNPQYEEYKI